MRTLLLADESITVQRVIALTFADEQIRVITVSDGQQAMERLAAETPDIVLAGTMLPQVSGYELARFMRSKPELREVPVLLLSGAFETVDEAQLKSSGANGVIEKPVEPTAVIGRVKELLGLKTDAKPATAGRLITSADTPADRKLPVATPPRAVTSTRGTPSKWEQLRDKTGLDVNTQSVEDSSTRSDDYLDTLDAAFDSLDQQISGRAPKSRNPSGPLGPPGGAGTGAPDPRSPGRRPHNGPAAAPNSVFEVDDEWFGGTESPSRADARAARPEIAEDLSDPSLRAPQPAPGSAPNPIFEVDDEWFAEDNKARAAKLEEQRELAAEMGIHDVELPEPALSPAPPVADLDFDFGIDDFRTSEPKPPAAPVPAIPAPRSPLAPEPTPVTPAASTASFAPMMHRASPSAIAPIAPVVSAPPPMPTLMPAAPVTAPRRDVADDFAELLAYEQGERPEPPATATAAVAAVPQITDDMLDQIAARVAERLSAGLLGDQLKNLMAATVRDTVRAVVSETSERLVRDEIDRIKTKDRT